MIVFTHCNIGCNGLRKREKFASLSEDRLAHLGFGAIHKHYGARRHMEISIENNAEQAGSELFYPP